MALQSGMKNVDVCGFDQVYILHIVCVVRVVRDVLRRSSVGEQR